MGTRRVSVRKVREDLRRLLDEVQAGDQVVVLRQGVEVGRFALPERKAPPLPDLSRFRDSIKVRGPALSQSVREARQSSRY